MKFILKASKSRTRKAEIGRRVAWEYLLMYNAHLPGSEAADPGTQVWTALGRLLITKLFVHKLLNY